LGPLAPEPGAGLNQGALAGWPISLLLPHQGQGQPGPGIAGELLAELLIELGRRRQVTLALHQVGQQQADRQGLGLGAGGFDV
jgi:hypothetical protein